MLPLRALLVRAPLVLLGAWLAASFVGAVHRAFVNTSPTRGVERATTPVDHGLPFEDVVFGTDDGLLLSGWWIPSKNGAAVVFTHGLGQTREDLLPRAAVLAREGYGVLLYDLRAHGDSDGERFPTSWKAYEDVRAATAFLLSRPDVDPARVGAFGFSVGASSTIRAAAHDNDLRALFLDGTSAAAFADQPPPRGVVEHALLPFEILYAPALARVADVEDDGPQIELLDDLADRPIFWVATGPARRQEARRALRYASFAPSTTGTWIVEETGHGGAYDARPAEYAAALSSFFAAALLDGSSPDGRERSSRAAD